jgi:hypothetical protein
LLYSFVLANTEFLHEKINTLSRRVRQLEDALEQSHSSLSTDPHPLLTPELRDLKKPLEKGTENDLLSSFGNAGLTAHIDLHNGDSVETNEVIDAVGSLSVCLDCHVCRYSSELEILQISGTTRSDDLPWVFCQCIRAFLSHGIYNVSFTCFSQLSTVSANGAICPSIHLGLCRSQVFYSLKEEMRKRKKRKEKTYLYQIAYPGSAIRSPFRQT